MAVEIRVPAVDVVTEEVCVVRWLKEKGQPVKAGEPILEVQTDKAIVEIESHADGVLLETFAKPDENVRVSQTLAVVGQPGEDISVFLTQYRKGG